MGRSGGAYYLLTSVERAEVKEMKERVVRRVEVERCIFFLLGLIDLH